MSQATNAYLEDHFDAHLARIREFVAQPTISTEDIGILDGAWMLRRYLMEAGFPEVGLVDTPGYPGVWASIDVGAPKTIASYGFFDSRPVGDRPWTYKPFSAALVDHPDHGRVVIGRGASSPKGPLVAWINSLEAMIKTDSLPVNVMLLLEGEEIKGSPHYPAMFESFKDRLSEADACFTGGMTQAGSGAVSVNLGFRGFLVLELRVSGERWGRGPGKKPLHSSLKNVADSPPSRLANVLASLTDANGAPLLDGLDEAVLPPSEEDERLISDLLERYGEEGVHGAIGLGNSPALGDIEGRELLMSYLYSPSININGVYSGYTGPGTEVFTVPEVATARLDLRLPPGLTCEHTLRRLRDHLDARGFEDVEIDVLADHDWSRTSVDTEIVRAVVDSYRNSGLDPSIWPYKGGGGPWSLYRSELGMPLMNGAGLGGGGSRDAGDEYLIVDGTDRVAGLLDSQKSQIDIVERFADM